MNLKTMRMVYWDKGPFKWLLLLFDFATLTLSVQGLGHAHTHKAGLLLV